MKYLGFIIGLLIGVSSAYAQQQPQSALTPLEQSLNQEWGAFQLAQQHISTAIVKITEEWKKDRETLANEREEWKKDRETLASEREYWANYVKGLYGEKPSQSMITPK